MQNISLLPQYPKWAKTIFKVLIFVTVVFLVILFFEAQSSSSSSGALSGLNLLMFIVLAIPGALIFLTTFYLTLGSGIGLFEKKHYGNDVKENVRLCIGRSVIFFPSLIFMIFGSWLYFNFFGLLF